MRIAFDVNDVLRDTFLKTEQVYRKFYMQDSETHSTSNYNQETDEWEKIEETDDFNYEVVSPITSLNLIEHFKFPTSEDLFEFFYIDFAMEIFGNSQSKTKDSFKILNDIYKEFREHDDVIVISDEIERSKPATLFFLSKNGCLVETIRFFSTVTMPNLWEDCDIIVTANPNIIDNSKNDTIIIKYNTTYNEKCVSDYNIDDISDVKNILKKIKNKND